MITIKKPKVEIKENKAVLTCEVEIDKNKKEIFYEIDKEYEQYLCTERSDAFVIAALHYAMKYHHDITCEVAMTNSLYHNITTYLIPTLAKHSNNLSIIKINAKLEDAVKSEGAVGTGVSCGIDSMHVLKNYLDPECDDMKLTHLCLNNVGSFNAYHERYHGIGSDNARNSLIERATKVAKEVNLPLIITDSNVHKVFNNLYYRVHTFANMFSVFLLQKLFSKYFYASSGYDLAYYNVTDTYKRDSAEYELLLFYVFNTENLKIYSEGSQKSRLEKTIDVAQFPLAQKHLHICIKDSKNCGKCVKCKRTLLSLDAIEKLDEFSEVFDIDYYKKNKEEYMEWLLDEVKDKSLMNTPTYELLMQKAGNTCYTEIEKYNSNNIIIPENELSSISIINNNEVILNKHADIKYKTSLYHRIYQVIELSKLKDKEIEIPRTLLTKNKKGFGKNIKLTANDLTYFILFKPKRGVKIIRYLNKKGIISKLENKSLKTKASIKDLSMIFSKFLENPELVKMLSVDNIKIKNIKIKNNNIFNNCKDLYYMNNEYDNTLVKNEGRNYIFLGQSGKYVVSYLASKKDKKSTYEDSTICYNLVKKLEDLK